MQDVAVEIGKISVQWVKFFFIFEYTRVNSFDFIELGMIQKIKKMDWTWFAVNLRIK